jgi:hypothetical protein
MVFHCSSHVLIFRVLSVPTLPVSIIDKSLQLANEIRHGGRHLDLLFGMEEATEVQRPHLERTVSS